MLNINMLEEKTYDFLIEAGWYKDRGIDISDWIKQLNREGYKIFPYAEEIIKSLGRLYIRPKSGIFQYSYRK